MEIQIFLKFSSLGLLIKLGFKPGLQGEKREQYLCAIPHYSSFTFFCKKNLLMQKFTNIFHFIWKTFQENISKRSSSSLESCLQKLFPRTGKKWMGKYRKPPKIEIGLLELFFLSLTFSASWKCLSEHAVVSEWELSCQDSKRGH